MTEATPLSDERLLSKMHGVSKAVYVACDEVVAKDIAWTLEQAASAISDLTATLSARDETIAKLREALKEALAYTPIGSSAERVIEKALAASPPDEPETGE